MFTPGYHPVVSGPPVKRSTKQDTSMPAIPTASPDSLQPAIDGPPSPERIRAYTEQMKRSSLFGNRSRSDTISSGTSSSRSGDSDPVSLSRKSSRRSTTNSTPSSRVERPESIQIFGKTIFSRGGRKSKRDNHSLAGSASYPTAREGPRKDTLSAKDNYYGRDGTSRRRHLISGPYNFQHLEHTRPDHVPNLKKASKMELASEFSASRASQVPTNGELKGIKTQNLHFENFSSEALNPSTSLEDLRPETSPRNQRNVVRKSRSPPQPHRSLDYSRSIDNLKAPPPRPPRSPLSPTCPIALPARTSSRTGSRPFDTIDPLATTTIERPQINGGFRRPSPFGLQPQPPPLPSWSEQEQERFSDRPMSHAMTTPGDEAWPLSPTAVSFGELPDVQEEDEDHPAPRRARISRTSTELRASQSVPSLRLRSYEQAHDRPETRMSTTLGQSLSHTSSAPRRQTTTPGFQICDDSWEKDVDYCYEHELEADCDYQWDRCSIEDDGPATEGNASVVQQPAMDLHLGDGDHAAYHGRFRPSLLVPSAYDLPELSPRWNASTTSDPRTPSNFLHRAPINSPSGASSFKESKGFNLSPSLLIPSDSWSQVEQEVLDEDHCINHSSSGSIFAQDPYTQSISPVDESTSSTASYRSSNFSRGSARSSSSTRMSVTHSKEIQDLALLLSRAASVSQAHRSIGSASSLPDLIPSSIRKSEQVIDTDLSSMVGSSNLPQGDEAAPAPEIAGPLTRLSSLRHRRNKSLVQEQGIRTGVDHFASPPPALIAEKQHAYLGSAAAPLFASTGGDGDGQGHERKISTPAFSPLVKEFKGRTRAATVGAAASATMVGVKRRGSYMLFPQM